MNDEHRFSGVRRGVLSVLLLETSKEKNLLSCSLAKSENSGTLTDVTVVTRPPVSNETFIHNVSEYFYSPQGC